MLSKKFSQKTLIILLSLHGMAILVSALRIYIRTCLRRIPFWIEDGVFGLTFSLNLAVFALVIRTYLTGPNPFILPSVYIATLNLYFAILWLTRASFVLSIGRPWRNDVRFRLFKYSTLGLIAMAPTYCTIINVTCEKKELAVEGITFCSLPEALIIVALVVDVLVEAAIFCLAYWSFTNCSIDTASKYMLIIAFGSNGLTLISSCVCWAFLLSWSYNDPPMIMSFVNVIAIVSTCICSFPIILTAVFRRLFPRRSGSTDSNSEEEIRSPPAILFARAMGSEMSLSAGTYSARNGMDPVKK
ncbi:hypothetical protein CVT26_009780 [Gymnopilus dilepis]|uniref:G-protein coupled receptors family 3 profile domain-containing protein n=1 Tax=Gymnopilus dilepis TaxID=231916 RepID=A0A409YIY3_9AGAR|nr:hypothetical protein CVT26_009780 [Gymnopilus dilepis]